MRKKAFVLATVAIAIFVARPLRAQQCGDGTCGADEHPVSCEPDCASPFGVFNNAVRTANGPSLEAAMDLGITRTRFAVPWYLVEPTETDGFDFTALNQYLDQQFAAAVSPIITLKAASPWGTAVSGDFHRMSGPPLDTARYEAYVRAIVTACGDRVKYWQIENEVFDNQLAEPNYWDGTKEEYLALLQTAAAAIRDVDPEAKIVLAGFANALLELVWEGDSDVSAFFHFLMDEGAPYFDVVDFHQYLDPEVIVYELSILQDEMAQLGYTKPIISTEAGDLDLRLFARHLAGEQHVPIIDELLNIAAVETELNAIIENGVSEQEQYAFSAFLKENQASRPILERYQAENLAKRIGLTLGLGGTQIHFLCMQDETVDHAVDWFHVAMCLIDVDGRRKPHFYAYQQIIDALAGFTAAEVVTSPAQTRVVRFRFADRQPSFLVWTASTENSGIPVDLSNMTTSNLCSQTPIITALDANGQPVIPTTENATDLVVTATVTPVLVETACVDRDGDGEASQICGGTDCDDDPTACGIQCHTQADEVCDGWDNDCDGETDETGCEPPPNPDPNTACDCRWAPHRHPPNRSDCGPLVLLIVCIGLFAFFALPGRNRRCGLRRSHTR